MAEKIKQNMEKSEPELLITRLINAPRSLVYQAWTDPEHLKHWQGVPRGFTVTMDERDVRPGGQFKICMHSSELGDHRVQGTYREVVPCERLVFTHCWLDADGKVVQETLITIVFKDCDGKTELTLRQTGFKSVESRDGHARGWASMLDRLAEYIASI